MNAATSSYLVSSLVKIPHRVDVSYAGVGANFGLRRRLQCDGLDRHGSWIRKVPTFGAGGRYGCYVVLGFTGIRDTLEVYLGAWQCFHSFIHI